MRRRWKESWKPKTMSLAVSRSVVGNMFDVQWPCASVDIRSKTICRSSFAEHCATFASEFHARNLSDAR